MSILYSLRIWSVLAVFVVGTLLPVFSLAASADTKLLVVEETLHLAAQDLPYIFDGITVKPAGSLIIDPGVTILLSEGATVTVAGFLSMEATAESQIRIAGNAGAMWNTVNVLEGAPPADLDYAVFESFNGPLNFYNQQNAVGRIALIDAYKATVNLEPKSGSMANVSLGDIHLVNQKLGVRMQESILRFKGSFAEVEIGNLVIRSGMQKERIKWDAMGIVVEGWFGTMVIQQTIFPHGCVGRTDDIDSFRKVVVKPDTGWCVSPTIPTVFVPGYGTSINLPLLTQLPGDAPQKDGWSFLSLLTPAYDYFLEEMHNQEIPVEIAYYDWRLPAKEAAVRYLKPAIEEAKKKYHTDTVNIVAHSFGGIIARTYVQGNQFQGDVAALVQIGTPNKGAAKAYGVWEGGELPSDWSALNYLLRFYAYRFYSKAPGNEEIIRRFFVSARDLLPTYPALFRKNSALDPRQLFFRNETLLELEENDEELFERVQVLTIGSQSEQTLIRLQVGPARSGSLWPDGKPSEIQYSLTRGGDGTVPFESVQLEGATVMQTEGSHNLLPAPATEIVVRQLYPERLFSKPAMSGSINTDAISFLFDCPIAVTIRLPDGTIYDSARPNGYVAISKDLIWMMVPRQLGEYGVSIKALADTPVRWWVNDGENQRVELRAGQTAYYVVEVDQDNEAKVSSTMVKPPLMKKAEEPGNSVERPPSPGIEVMVPVSLGNPLTAVYSFELIDEVSQPLTLHAAESQLRKAVNNSQPSEEIKESADSYSSRYSLIKILAATLAVLGLIGLLFVWVRRL